VNELDLAEAVDHDRCGSPIDAELLGPTVCYRNTESLQVMAREERCGLFGIASDVHRQKVRAGMRFLEFLQRGQLRAARQSTRSPEGQKRRLPLGGLIIESLSS